MPKARIQRRIEVATKRFAAEIAQIVQEETTDDLIAELRAELDAFDRKGKKRGRKKVARKAARRAPTRRAGRGGGANYDKLIPRLVSLIKKNGGEIAPGIVSKEFGLSSEQRRSLARRAAAQRLVKITGTRRTTRYVLR